MERDLILLLYFFMVIVGIQVIISIIKSKSFSIYVDISQLFLFLLLIGIQLKIIMLKVSLKLNTLNDIIIFIIFGVISIIFAFVIGIKFCDFELEDDEENIESNDKK